MGDTSPKVALSGNPRWTHLMVLHMMNERNKVGWPNTYARVEATSNSRYIIHTLLQRVLTKHARQIIVRVYFHAYKQSRVPQNRVRGRYTIHSTRKMKPWVYYLLGGEITDTIESIFITWTVFMKHRSLRGTTIFRNWSSVTPKTFYWMQCICSYKVWSTKCRLQELLYS